jgi:hypothetical protein
METVILYSRGLEKNPECIEKTCRQVNYRFLIQNRFFFKTRIYQLLGVKIDHIAKL